MDSQPQFVIHPVAGDKEYLQPLVMPVWVREKNKYPRRELREFDIREMEKKKEVILIVDDDRASRRMLARALGVAGTCREAPADMKRFNFCAKKLLPCCCSIFACRNLTAPKL